MHAVLFVYLYVLVHISAYSPSSTCEYVCAVSFPAAAVVLNLCKPFLCCFRNGAVALEKACDRFCSLKQVVSQETSFSC